MERERTTDPQEELQTAGRQAADALRGYGYPDLAQEYERTLHRSALDSREVLTHSRIANTTLKELNELAEEHQGKHPALERNVLVQERLDAALQKQQELSLPKANRIEDLSFPAKMYLEENSKPLENAAQEVKNYLEEKRIYFNATENKIQLGGDLPERQLDIQLQSYRSLPTSYNMENLERYTRQGIEVMREDLDRAKTTLQRENEDYVRERMYLSPEGKASILREVEKGEFMMPNQQRGYIVESRADHAQQQLDQYTKTKEQIFSIDQERDQGPSWTMPTAVPAESTVDRDRQEQVLATGTPAGPAVEKDDIGAAGGSADKADTWRTTLEKDYSHLSAEQQERFADSKIISVEPSKDREMEI